MKYKHVLGLRKRNNNHTPTHSPKLALCSMVSERYRDDCIPTDSSYPFGILELQHIFCDASATEIAKSTITLSCSTRVYSRWIIGYWKSYTLI